MIEPLNSFVVNVDATTAQIAEIQDQEQAEITPSGTSTIAYGIVSSISTVGTTTSGVTTFPVTIAVTGNPAGLYAGASADVEIIVRQATNVLVVPTTAVHSLGTSSYVDLLKNGKEVEQTVTIGAEGSPYTQITSGLKEGQEVVIASLSATIPSSTGTGTGRAVFGGGGFGGGGFGGGGGLGGGGGFAR